jgi:hypothetical protein
MPEPRILIVGAGALGAALAATLSSVALVVVAEDFPVRAQPELFDLADCALLRDFREMPEPPSRRAAPGRLQAGQGSHRRRRKRKSSRWYLDTSFVPIREPIHE